MKTHPELNDGEHGYLELDLHVHSDRSPDGFSGPDELFRRARKVGLDGLSITDHDRFDPERFERLQRRTDLLLIPGQEITTPFGHVLAYFIREPIDPCVDPRRLVERIHDQNGVAVLAHPFRNTVFTAGRIPYEWFDGVEVFNARSGDPDDIGSPNHRARRTLEKYGGTLTGGSDAHFSWEVGRGRTRVRAPGDMDAVRTALIEGATRVKPGRVSPQSCHTLSSLVRFFRRPNLRSGVKLLPNALRRGGKDLRWMVEKRLK